VNGLEIAERYYLDEVRPALRERHSAALLGAGSEVLGYDDDVSPDHDFGKRVQISTRTGTRSGSSSPRSSDSIPEKASKPRIGC
jgi:hypothetical protein